MFGKKFPSDYKNAICETCAYWDKSEEGVDVLNEVLGDKRRMGYILDSSKGKQVDEHYLQTISTSIHEQLSYLVENLLPVG